MESKLRALIAACRDLRPECRHFCDELEDVIDREREAKKLEIPPASIHYPEDVARIIALCAAAGYEIDAATAQWAWCSHSEEYAASWLFLPEDDTEVMRRVLKQFEVEP